MKPDEPITLGRKRNYNTDRIDSPVHRTILEVLRTKGESLLEDLCVEVWRRNTIALGLGGTLECKARYPNYHKFRCHFYGPSSLSATQRKLVEVKRNGSSQAVYASLTDLGMQVAMSLKEREE